jgi:IS30 family transposase
MAAAVSAMLMPLGGSVMVITFDNGLEFAQHMAISEAL